MLKIESVMLYYRELLVARQRPMFPGQRFMTEPARECSLEGRDCVSPLTWASDVAVYGEADMTNIKNGQI